jgi:two-component system response regulator DegU
MMKNKILIVDDHGEFRKRARAFIEAKLQGITVYEAVSETEAVKTAKKEKPFIILLELQLPQMNGIKTAELIKKVSPESKIIIVSMYDAEKYKDRIITKNIDHVIGKNEFDTELLKILRKYLLKR